jgi:hypothetical protein
MSNPTQYPDLASHTTLDLLNTYACGTVRTNRKGVPKAFTAVKRMKQGDGIFRRKGNLLAVKFHDKRDIHMLTTFHEAKLLVTDRVNKNNEPVVKPNTIIDYCKYMGGVDVSLIGRRRLAPSLQGIFCGKCLPLSLSIGSAFLPFPRLGRGAFVAS